MVLARAAVRGATASWIGAVLGFSIRFAANAFLARMIAPEIFGEFALAFVYSEMIGILAAAGFGNCVVQFDEPPELTIPVALQLNGVVALAIVASGAAAGGYALMVGDASGVLVFSLCVGKALTILLGTYEFVLQRNMQFALLARYRVYGVVAGTTFAALLALLNRPYAALFSRELLAGIVPAFAMMRHVRFSWAEVFRPSDVVRSLRVRAFQLGRELFWVQALDTVYQRLDQVLLGWLLGPAKLGFYYQAKYVAGLPPAAVMPATQTIALRVFVGVARDPGRLRRALELMQVFAAHALMLAALILALAPRPLVLLTYGERWEPMIEILPFFAPWVVLQPLAHNAQLALTALTRWRPIRISRGVQLAILGAAAPIAVKIWGSVGAALAVGLAVGGTLIALIVGLDSTQRPDPRAYRSVVTGTLGALLVAWFLRDLPDGGGLSDASGLGALVRTATALTAYVASALLFGGTAIREMLGRVGKELRPQKASESTSDA